MSERGDGRIKTDEDGQRTAQTDRFENLTPAVRPQAESDTKSESLTPAVRQRAESDTKSESLTPAVRPREVTDSPTASSDVPAATGMTRRERESAEFDQRVRYASEAIRQDDPRIDPELLLEYTTDRRDLHPSVRIQWGIWTTVGVVILSVILTSVIPIVGLPSNFGGGIFLLLLGLGFVWIVLRYRRWVYQIQDDSLYLERGVVTHRRTHVPYVRIQHVDTSRSPIERWLGLSTLVVYTAGSRGADVSIPGLLPDEASDLQERVKQLAIEAEGGDAL